MSGYVFIGNSTKPTQEKLNDRSNVKLDNVSIPCLKNALNMGFDVIVGINRNKPEELKSIELPVKFYDSHTYRSIVNLHDNYIAYKNLCNVIEKNDIEVIHCNTPVGGLIGRLVGKKYHIKKVIYTAHGFHFFKGAPLFNRTILKWAEQIMAHWTDAIITMNQEDYESAQKFTLKKGGKIYKVHGVGITLSDFQNTGNRKEKRVELNLNDDDIALISAGDLVPRKNYTVAIEAIAQLNTKNIHYFICGRGPELENLKELSIQLGIENQIHFLGFRTDIKELLFASDIFLFSTFQEGLPRSMMEAMACGLPCIASNIRGNNDLIIPYENGILCDPNSPNEFADAINTLIYNSKLREKMSHQNLLLIKDYDVDRVKEEIRAIYSEVIGK
ncbi:MULTISPECIES: glycosyltransferase family 4 protein [Coprobacillaceae]|uniref:glycosyltransferase family 4 protein n=1 Tax=Coprobacillaceae TaxID=2810280 RepID=UPI000E50B2F8|nr:MULTISPECIES: glycosyltransferase family 4 protein [Coprobacillaceae]RHM62812.1 glycosyltransferase family 1 protein [Coprobacillus sp. AF33-1AC]RHS96109.1 glycosyltransferase family 1 protein [Erysipelatoclostridium sp. AM42-17]